MNDDEMMGSPSKDSESTSRFLGRHAALVGDDQRRDMPRFGSGFQAEAMAERPRGHLAITQVWSVREREAQH
jgi:hypothetical protein